MFDDDVSAVAAIERDEPAYGAAMQAWTTVTAEELLDRRPWARVEDRTVRLPDGTEIDGWLWFDLPAYAIVVPVTETGEVLCFRQVKYAADGVALAPPGGYIDPGEEPLAAAQRELLEETGHEAPEWRSLGRYVVDGNRGCGTAHLFLATGARKVTEPDADDLEEQHLVTLSLAEFRAAVLGGDTKVLAWAAAGALALVALDAR